MTPGRDPRNPRAGAEPTEQAIGERRFRALSEPLDCHLRAGGRYPHVDVRNPVRRTQYLTLFPSYPDRTPAFCTCTDFARRGFGDCKHIEAAWRWLLAHRATGSEEAGRAGTGDVEALWEQIDRRLAGEPPLSARGLRALALAGRVLFEHEPRD